ncbi:MAG: hypothetical protein KDA80_20700 [Planctomycetaceae bacterium]|nr:hypothetical protein [Planctomycetaceae bacterium]
MNVTTSLDLPRISASDARWHSELFGVSRRIPITIDGESFQLSFHQPYECRTNTTDIALVCGEITFAISFPTPHELSSCIRLLEDSDWSALPGALQLAALEAAFSDTLDTLGNHLGRSVRFEPLPSREQANFTCQFRMTIKATNWNQTVVAEVLTDDSGIDLLMHFVRKIPPVRNRDCADIVLPGFIEIGAITLPIADFRSLKPSDIILLDLPREPGFDAIVRFGLSISWHVTLDDGFVTFQKRVAADGVSQGAFAGPRIALTFQDGEVPVPLDELATIIPGMETPILPTDGILVRAQGQPFARGEIVPFKKQVGIRLRSIIPNHLIPR